MMILTGPQGSGNHMWAKIFALHPEVYGWSALLDNYWIGHDQEPFADCWHNPELLKTRDWSTHDYYVTSISAPYMYQGQLTTPDFQAFARVCRSLNIIVKFAILGRDKNILELQQQRVRNDYTVTTAIEEFNKFEMPVFLSYELLQLYGSKYIDIMSQRFPFPVAAYDPRVAEIIAEDKNKKYISQCDPTETDVMAQKASGLI